MIHPGPVIEISCLDLIPERALRASHRMVLSGTVTLLALSECPRSMISPQFVRLRDDKEATVEDVSFGRSAIGPVPDVERPAIEAKSTPSSSST